MTQIQTETRKQQHLTEMIALEKEKPTNTEVFPTLEEIEKNKDESEQKAEQEKSRLLLQEMSSDLTNSNIKLPASFFKMVKNNEGN